MQAGARLSNVVAISPAGIRAQASLSTRCGVGWGVGVALGVGVGSVAICGPVVGFEPPRAVTTGTATSVTAQRVPTAATARRTPAEAAATHDSGRGEAGGRGGQVVGGAVQHVAHQGLVSVVHRWLPRVWSGTGWVPGRSDRASPSLRRARRLRFLTAASLSPSAWAVSATLRSSQGRAARRPLDPYAREAGQSTDQRQAVDLDVHGSWSAGRSGRSS